MTTRQQPDQGNTGGRRHQPGKKTGGDFVPGEDLDFLTFRGGDLEIGNLLKRDYCGGGAIENSHLVKSDNFQNSVKFDFVMLQKENYKSLLPIYITNTQGSEHSDFLQVARTSKLFFPDCIKTVLSDKGNAIFKLDSLGPLNFPDLDTKKFHTAIQDCETLLRVMKKLKQSAGEIFESSKLTTTKLSARKIIEKELDINSNLKKSDNLFTTPLIKGGRVSPQDVLSRYQYSEARRFYFLKEMAYHHQILLF